MKGLLLIGEKLNASKGSVREALETRNRLYIQDLARQQAEAGADSIDINVGTGSEEEPSIMEWAVEAVQEVVDKPLALDTADHRVLAAGLAKCEGTALVNSINGEEERLSSFLPLLQRYGSPCIALAMDGRGIPKEPAERVEVCINILRQAERYGVGVERIYFDPAVTPLAVGEGSGWTALETLRLIKQNLPGAKTALGLSNISYGLPKRSLLNQAFLSMALVMGLDCVILDPLDERLVSILRAGCVLVGQDKGCKEYIKSYRKGRLK
jgi:5-methyltetrahydrofolate--homocysteine methyltransferase